MELINKVQRQILSNFGQLVDSEQFYLTGGTALTYFYLKHRSSNDLDFFTSTEELIAPVSQHLEDYLNAKGMSVERQRGMHSFVELLVRGDKEITLVRLALDSAFRLEPVKEFTEYPKLKVDNLVDIACNKLLALFGRASLRDFIDVYFLIRKAHFKVEELMNNAKKKDPGFDLYWLGVALERINTFRDESLEMLLLVEPVRFMDLVSFFNHWRERIAKEFKP